jgi:hypothetical protein
LIKIDNAVLASILSKEETNISPLSGRQISSGVGYLALQRCGLNPLMEKEEMTA